MEALGIAANIVSLALGGFAIWLSVYFYNQSKNTETNVRLALEAIKTQTDALQNLNNQTTNWLIKSVTTPRV